MGVWFAALATLVDRERNGDGGLQVGVCLRGRPVL